MKAPRFQHIWHMKVVRLSALHTGHLHPTGNIPGTHFCYRLSREMRRMRHVAHTRERRGGLQGFGGETQQKKAT
jgi:hypothetical protein